MRIENLLEKNIEDRKVKNPVKQFIKELDRSLISRDSTKKEDILKENKVYFIDCHRNDYTQVISVDTGRTYKFNYMQDYIDRNLKIATNGGDYIIAVNGKFEKYDGSITIENEKVEKIIEKRKQEIENDKLNRKENLKEGTQFIIEEKLSNSKIIVTNKSNGKQSYMGLYTNQKQLEELKLEGIDYIYCYKTNNETINNLNENDRLIANQERIIKI